VLKDVGYGAVSAYVAISPGQYTVAMRGSLNACAARTALRQAAPVGAADGAAAYVRTRPPGCTHACFAGTGQHD
jgi:hypothetical protein